MSVQRITFNLRFTPKWRWTLYRWDEM